LNILKFGYDFQCFILSFGTVQSISTFENAQNNTLTSQHGGFEFSRRDSSRFFNSHFFESSQFTLPAFHQHDNKEDNEDALRTRLWNMAVECSRRKGFTFDTHDNYAWFRDRLVILRLLSLVKKLWGSWKNSGTFYRYSCCFV